MNRQIKKYIVLSIAILIPLLATYLIGAYGYNSDKFGQGAWKDEFKDEYLTFGDEDTTIDKIEKYLNYGTNNQYYLYNEIPIFRQMIKANDVDLFRLDIYKAIYKTTITNEDDSTSEVDRVQYLFFIYDVQYQNIRDQIPADSTLRKEINESNVPSFSIKMTEIIATEEEDEEVTPKSKDLKISELTLILDEGADFDNISGEILEADEESISRRLAVVLGSVNMDDLNWSTSSKVEITAKVAATDAEVSEVLATLELDLSAETGDISGYQESNQQTLEKVGYFKWVFKNYLWWIGLITLVASSLITFSFYGVYLAEVKEYQEQKRKPKMRR
ncbi:MAG: hypothetical protein PHX62_04105 [Bacilli bacterium]|nr:hypothetical protein [Bacilli bacterium]